MKKVKLRAAMEFIFFALLIFFIQWGESFIVKASLDGWYSTLLLPKFQPPKLLFAPVWTLLYLMIALSGWWVWHFFSTKPIKKALTVFALALLLNFAWTPIFFYFQSPGWALVSILALDGMIFWNIYLFWRISKFAAALLVPYALWTLYATLLNGAIWQMN